MDLTALGELLIDFTAGGTSENGMALFEQNPGGAPANVLTVLANFGMETAFIGKVGRDMHGDFLAKTLAGKGIDITGLIVDENVFTTLAFVQLAPSGERSFSFARKPGADTCLRPDEINAATLRCSRVFHFGSLSLTNEPARFATLAAIKIARQAGAVISYDPNYRAPLWGSEAEAVARMRSVLKMVDVIKISDEELHLLTDETTPKKAAGKLLAQGIGCVVVTLGKKGALVATKEGSRLAEGYRQKVIDTTGAGDAFWGGFLYKLLKLEGTMLPLPLEEAVRFARFANAVAALCCQKRGAIPAMPRLTEVEEFIRQHPMM